MSTPTVYAGHAVLGTPAREGGLLQRLLRGIVAAREARARREVAHHLARLGDAELAALGIPEREIRRLRSPRSGPVALRP
jgi:hypothetical protein